MTGRSMANLVALRRMNLFTLQNSLRWHRDLRAWLAMTAVNPRLLQLQAERHEGGARGKDGSKESA